MNNASENSISVVVPVYNNESTLAELVTRLSAVLTEIADFEVILVDDGSSDRSWRIAEGLSHDFNDVVALRLSRNFGQHRALTAGLHRATGDLVVFMDADLEDRPEEIPLLLEKLSDPDLDVVYTQWETPGVSPSSTSRLFNWTYGRMAGVEMPPNLGAFRAFRSNVADALRSYGEQGLVYATAMPQMGFNSTFVTVKRDDPDGNETSYTLRKRLRLASQILTSYSDLPHKMVTTLGIGLSVVAGVYLAVVVVLYMMGNQLPDGLTLILGVTVLLSGVLLFTVGALFSYTYRIYQEVLGRPRYHVARATGLGLDE